MSRQKVGMQWRKHIVAVQKCTFIVDCAGSRFQYCLLKFWRKLYIKLQQFITDSYSIQIIHILVHWNPLENGEKTIIIFFILIIVSSVNQLIVTVLGKLPYYVPFATPLLLDTESTTIQKFPRARSHGQGHGVTCVSPSEV
jgi:hypothetical protein